MPTLTNSHPISPEKEAISAEIKRHVFYFDLSFQDSTILGSLSTILGRVAARQATFLDKNVTHLVTDKASIIAESYSNSLKWQMKVWTLNDFVQMMSRWLEKTPFPEWASFKRAILSRTRDLNQCLEEERQVSKLKPSRMTPLYGGTNNAAGSKITTNVKPSTNTGSATKGKSVQPLFRPFKDPFVLIEEGDMVNAPLFKEYPMSRIGRVTFPVIRSDSIIPHCPFSYSTRPNEQNIYHSTMEKVIPVDPMTDLAQQQHQARQKASKAALHNKRASFGGDQIKKTAKPKPGYCECCCEKYEDLRVHTITDKHRQFAAIEENYLVVDRLLGCFSRPLRYSYNPILSWSAKSKAVSHTIMSPAHSTVYTKRTSSSSLRTAHLPPTVEDKENDSPSGLDLTGVDKGGYGGGEKRRPVPVDAPSSDIFETGRQHKKHAKRPALSKIKL